MICILFNTFIESIVKFSYVIIILRIFIIECLGFNSFQIVVNFVPFRLKNMLWSLCLLFFMGVDSKFL